MPIVLYESYLANSIHCRVTATVVQCLDTVEMVEQDHKKHAKSYIFLNKH